MLAHPQLLYYQPTCTDAHFFPQHKMALMPKCASRYTVITFLHLCSPERHRDAVEYSYTAPGVIIKLIQDEAVHPRMNCSSNNHSNNQKPTAAHSPSIMFIPTTSNILPRLPCASSRSCREHSHHQFQPFEARASRFNPGFSGGKEGRKRRLETWEMKHGKYRLLDMLGLRHLRAVGVDRVSGVGVSCNEDFAR